MTIDEEDFKRKTEREIKNYDLLKSIFSKLHDIESELKKKRDSSFEDIASIEENDNDIIKNKKDSPPQNIMSKFLNIFNSNEPKEIESNLSIKNDNTPQSDKILNENMNSNRELIKQLNEEKNKNKQLLNELNNEKKKVLELTNKIKFLEETYSNNDKFKKINELEKLIRAKD